MLVVSQERAGSSEAERLPLKEDAEISKFSQLTIMKNYIKRLSQKLLERYRWKFSLPVRAFLEKHYLLERKRGVYFVPLTISYSTFQHIDVATRNEVLSEDLIDRVWEHTIYLIRHNYCPEIKTLSVFYLAKTGDAERLKVACDYMYRDNAPSFAYMEEIIKAIKKEIVLFFFEKASIVRK